MINNPISLMHSENIDHIIFLLLLDAFLNFGTSCKHQADNGKQPRKRWWGYLPPLSGMNQQCGNILGFRQKTCQQAKHMSYTNNAYDMWTCQGISLGSPLTFCSCYSNIRYSFLTMLGWKYSIHAGWSFIALFCREMRSLKKTVN